MSRTNHPRSTGFEDLSGLGGFDSHLAESGPRSICVLSLPIYLKDDMSALSEVPTAACPPNLSIAAPGGG